MRIKEWIVVEGRSDTAAIHRAVDADTIETGGSAIGEEVIQRIRLAQAQRGVIIFTDPDYPGERIRKVIQEHVKGCKHAFLPKEEAMGKGKIGIEHASVESIRKALAGVKTEGPPLSELISWGDLVELGLIGNDSAKERRIHLGKILGIGYANGRQLHKRLNAFQIGPDDLIKALEQIEQEEGLMANDRTHLYS